MQVPSQRFEETIGFLGVATLDDVPEKIEPAGDGLKLGK